MSEALGDYVYIQPISYEIVSVATYTIGSGTPTYVDRKEWMGRVVDNGAKVIIYSTIHECDEVKYYDSDIYNTTIYGSVTVHVVSFQNIRKIEGVY